MNLLFVTSLDAFTSQVYLVESILFLFFLFQIVYLLIFTFGSLSKSRMIYPHAEQEARFAILITAQSLDEALLGTIRTLREQDYSSDLVDLYVIGNVSDKSMIKGLSPQHVTFISADFSSKLEQTKRAMKVIQQKGVTYHMVLLVNSGNQFDSDYLTKINNAFYSGCFAIQTHRIIKDPASDMQYLSAIGEEINNAIFRRGHTHLGFSSALLESGMAFDFDIFSDFLKQARGKMLSKELERYLLFRNVYIEYFEHAYVYDRALIDKGFYQNRSRWQGNRLYNLFAGFYHLPTAMFNGQFDYCNKLLQWILPSRILLVILVFLLALFFSTTFLLLAIKWWILFLLLLIIFCLAIPNYLVSNRLLHIMLTAPFLFVFLLFKQIPLPHLSAKKEKP